MSYKEDPFTFQGANKNDNYFEGWYFKHVSSDLKNIISIIPGISKGRDSHGFIQVIISYSNYGKIILNTYYNRFSLESFSCSNNPFVLKIGNNIFNKEGIKLDFENEEILIKGKMEFSKFTPINRNLFSPNAMGFFAYFPFMECNHDIVSMNHRIKGLITINNKSYDFNNGKGYIEKDWGTSFPKEYIWLQSNHFGDRKASIMFSLAHIPFLGASFQGFICYLTFDGEEHRFATYNNSRVAKVNYSEDLLDIHVTKGAYKLIIKAKVSHDSGNLKAPINGDMSNMIKEGLCGSVHIILLKDSITIFEDTGNPCAIEIHK